MWNFSAVKSENIAISQDSRSCTILKCEKFKCRVYFYSEENVRFCEIICNLFGCDRKNIFTPSFYMEDFRLGCIEKRIKFTLLVPRTNKHNFRYGQCSVQSLIDILHYFEQPFSPEIASGKEKSTDWRCVLVPLPLESLPPIHPVDCCDPRYGRK